MYNREYQQKYYQENKERILKRNKERFKNKRKEILEQRQEYYKKNRETLLRKSREWHKSKKGQEYSLEYHRKNKEKIRKKIKEWKKNHKEHIKEQSRKYYKELKLKTMQIISGKKIPECIYCGCKDIRLLEVNYKNLGGNKEAKGKLGSHFYLRIVKGLRGIDDLEIACRVCNAYHYVNKKFGAKYRIEYLG